MPLCRDQVFCNAVVYQQLIEYFLTAYRTRDAIAWIIAFGFAEAGDGHNPTLDDGFLE